METRVLRCRARCWREFLVDLLDWSSAFISQEKKVDAQTVRSRQSVVYGSRDWDYGERFCLLSSCQCAPVPRVSESSSVDGCLLTAGGH